MDVGSDELHLYGFLALLGFGEPSLRVQGNGEAPVIASEDFGEIVSGLLTLNDYSAGPIFEFWLMSACAIEVDLYKLFFWEILNFYQFQFYFICL